jgi:resolvase-like protein
MAATLLRRTAARVLRGSASRARTSSRSLSAVFSSARYTRSSASSPPRSELKASDVGLEFLTGELKGSHDPSGIVFTVLAAMSGMEREYIRDRTLEGHESARKRGKTIGGAGVTDNDMLSMALHLRNQEMSLRDIAKRLVITTGAKRGPASLARHRHADAPRTRRADGHRGEYVIPPLLCGWCLS